VFCVPQDEHTISICFSLERRIGAIFKTA